MDLYLMRHGAALTKEEARVPEDAQRPLSPEGWATVRRVADGLQSMGVRPSHLLTSPFLRATQTASCVAEVLGSSARVEACDALSPAHDPADFQLQLDRFTKEEMLLVISHQPLLGQLVRGLVFGGTSQAGLSIPPAGVCALWVPDPPSSGHAVIRGVWDPELFLW